MASPASGPRADELRDAGDARRRFVRLANAGALLALSGVALAGVILYVHGRLDGAGDGYTSFCTVNERIDCDQVLTSPFARVFGAPVAWLAVLAYASIASLLHLSARGEGASTQRHLRAALTLIGASGAVTLYFAGVALFVVGAVCLMCAGLYLIGAGLLWIAFKASDRPVEIGRGASDRRWLVGGFAGSALAVGTLAGASWPTPDQGACRPVDVAEVPAEFLAWYTAQPRVEQPALGGERHYFGSPQARVTIIEFLDFECGYCRKNHRELEGLLARHRDDLRVVYRHFPLDASCNESVTETIHPRACRAAEAAECAAAQGRFAEMADAMFERQTQLFETNLFRIAARIGIDMDAFGRCMNEHQMLPRVLEDCRAGRRSQLTSTPTLFINDRRVIGSIKQPCGYDYAIAIERGAGAAPAPQS